MKKAIGAFALVTGILAGAILLTYRMLVDESNIQSYHYFFPRVVMRAIQLRDVGYLGEHYWRGNEEPASYNRAREILRELNLSDGQLNCDMGFALEPIDATEFRPVVGLLLSDRPLRYAVFFHGDSPDISAFFDPDRNDDLIGQVLRFGEISPEFNANGGLLNGSDLTRSFDAIMSAAPGGYDWASTECDGYSFFEFWGN